MCLREKIGPDPRNFNQRVSLGRNDLLIRTFPNGYLNISRGVNAETQYHANGKAMSRKVCD
jgi:hypothetical protein